MSKQTKFFGGVLSLFLATAVFAFIAVNASAQSGGGNLAKFTLQGDAAKRAMTSAEINGETAEKLAKACEEDARAHNQSVSIFILSPSGTIVHAHRMDGQLPINTDTGLYKAQTALYMRVSSHEAANRFNSIDARVIRQRLNLYLVSGGLPIIVDNQLIGAIGVGGGNMDEQCAYDALTKVIGPQPPLAPNAPFNPLGAPGAGAPGGAAQPAPQGR